MFTAGPLRSRRVRSFIATMGPSDFPAHSCVLGSLRFRTFLSARATSSHPEEPSGCRLVSLHRKFQASAISEAWPLLLLCNEAEASSILLRLTGSPHRASPWGLLLSAPVWLHVGHSINMILTFHNIRLIRFSLAYQRHREKRKQNQSSAPQCLQ